jgi:enoyl-CoA hydratase
MRRLLESMPPPVVADLIVAGASLTADEARVGGLVTRLVSDDVALRAYCETISGGAPASVRANLAALRELADPQRRVSERTEDWLCAVYASDDRREALAAFADKRPPSFRGRA